MKIKYIISIVFLLSTCIKQQENKIWYDAKEHEVYIKDGIAYINESKITGVVFGFFDSIDTAFINPYKSGRLNGVLKVWYSNGQLQEERMYVAGRREGLQKGWYKDGKPKYIATYKENMYHGNVKEWFPNGQLYRDFNYVNGQEEGLQKMYWDTGELRANYESKNGRKYGLTGIKNCATPWDDSLKRLFDTGM